MSYRIERRPHWIEVQVWGDVNKAEAMEAVRRLRSMDPHKRISDLWVVGEGCVIPLADYATIVASVRALCPADMVGSKSAIVVHDQLQKAQMDIYRREAASLPFAIGVFLSKTDAEAWLTGQEVPADAEP